LILFRTEPNDIFGKAMSIEDGVMRDWFLLLTRLPEEEIKALLAGTRARQRSDWQRRLSPRCVHERR
jgi:tyrosyl-tRNA synthetase